MRRENQRRLVEIERDLNRAQSVAQTGSWHWDVHNDEIIWSDETYRIFGVSKGSPHTYETFLAFVHPEDRDFVDRSWQATESGVPYDLVHRIVIGGGEVKWVRERAELEYDDRGQLVHVFGTTQDITALKLAEEAARASDRQLLFVTDNAPVYLARCDCEQRYRFINKGYATYFGVNTADVIGKSVVQVLGSSAYDKVKSHIETVLSGQAIEFDAEIPYKNIGPRWMHVAYVPDISADGKVCGFLSVIHDITERKRIELALRESEKRLQAIVDTATDAIVVIDSRGIICSANPAVEKMFGHAPREIVGRNVSILMPEPDRSRHDEYLTAYQATGKAKIIGIGREVLGLKKEGTTFPVDLAIAQWSVGEQQFFTGILRDITERKQQEERAALMMREVNHRAKNLLAVVQAVALQTAGEDDPKLFAQHFSDRLAGLAASQDLLVRSEWMGVDLRDLIASQLAHFADLFGTRITFGGPVVQLRPTAAQAIGMALHELATNAAKYGSLSVLGGHVYIHWRFIADRTQKQFHIQWSEQDGPPVTLPTRRGFGHTVIVNMSEYMLSADVSIAYPPSGLLWQMTAPVENVCAPPTPAARQP